MLALPGIFRGALDARATAITEDMEVAADRALAEGITPDGLRATYIIPSPFNDRVAAVFADAVRNQARRDNVTATPTEPPNRN